MNWNEFAVIDSKAPDANLKERVYISGSHQAPNFLPMVTCARQVFATTAEALPMVPNFVVKSTLTTIHRGMNAYKFIMQFYTGLDSRNLFESHVAGQIRDAWQTHKARHPATPLTPYIDAVIHDGNMIRDNLLAPHLRRPSAVNIAIEMAQLTPEKKALIICGDDTKATVDCITAMGHWKRQNPGVISITHPDAEKLNEISTAVGLLPAHRAVTVPILSLPLERAVSVELGKADAVFVCQPLGSAIDDVLCSHWQSRLAAPQKSAARLIHLRTPEEDQGSLGLWGQFSNYGLITRAAIKREQNQRVDVLRIVSSKALETIDVMADLRTRGSRLVSLMFDVAKTSLSYRAGRVPLGADSPEAKAKASRQIRTQAPTP